MERTISLYHFSADYIMEFVSRHPIDWSNGNLAKKGGPGDQAGMPPTPAVLEFLNLLDQKQDLFTQAEYANFCIRQWADWLLDKKGEQFEGVEAKLYRNFYPAMIDSLHVWAMISEAGWFDVCILDAYLDAIGKKDLILKSQTCTVKVALLGPTSRAKRYREYKLNHRQTNGQELDIVEVQLPWEYERRPGNKRWFRLNDFDQVRDIAIEANGRREQRCDKCDGNLVHDAFVYCSNCGGSYFPN